MSSLQQWLTLLTAVLGLVGSALLFFNSYGLLPHLGFLPGRGDNERINEINRRWRVRQRVGFGLLCASFVVQGVAAFLTLAAPPP